MNHFDVVITSYTGSFAVLFYIYEEYSEVYVQNVLYQKRDLRRVLSERYPDIGELGEGKSILI